MENKTLIHHAIVLCAGIVIGGTLVTCVGWKKMLQTQPQPMSLLPLEKSAQMHMMPDGSMMKNEPAQATSMSAMMHDMNANLKGKTGDAFDKAFLEEMIVHHRGAVDMAKLVLETSKRSELRKLAEDIIKAQEKEIAQMKTWQAEWFK